MFYGEEDSEKDKEKRKYYYIGGGVCLCIVIIAIVLGVTLGGSKSHAQEHPGYWKEGTTEFRVIRDSIGRF